MQSEKVLKNAFDNRADLITLLYDTVYDPAVWNEFMQRLVDVMGSRSARLLVMNKEADVVERSLKVAIDDQYHQQYVDYYVNSCPWRPELRSKPPGRLYSTYLDFSCPQKEFLESEFFNDWARPQDIAHGICGTIHTQGSNTVQLLVQRTKTQNYFTHQETSFVNGLVPHMQRAMELAGRFQQTEAVGMAAEQSSLPFVLLGEDGRVLFVSKNAEQMIANEPDVSIKQHRLTSSDGGFSNKLKTLIHTVTSSAGGTWHSAGGTLLLPRQGKSDLAIMVNPVGGKNREALLVGQRPFAALFFYDPDVAITLQRDLLESYYGLTYAEAEVAELLVQGNELREIAERNRISLHTVRNQLKSIFAKTNTSRQAELVSRLMSGPARTHT
ncbi:helix-turn-helix transcriptional regulator [Pseudomonadota bacterium]